VVNAIMVKYRIYIYVIITNLVVFNYRWWS
jgi:hypothetical protein